MYQLQNFSIQKNSKNKPSIISLRIKCNFVTMNKKELQIMNAYLQKQRKEVSTSKKAARKLLLELGLITPTGKLSKSFRPVKMVN